MKLLKYIVGVFFFNWMAETAAAPPIGGAKKKRKKKKGEEKKKRRREKKGEEKRKEEKRKRERERKKKEEDTPPPPPQPHSHSGVGGTDFVFPKFPIKGYFSRNKVRPVIHTNPARTDFTHRR